MIHQFSGFVISEVSYCCFYSAYSNYILGIFFPFFAFVFFYVIHCCCCHRHYHHLSFYLVRIIFISHFSIAISAIVRIVIIIFIIIIVVFLIRCQTGSVELTQTCFALLNNSGSCLLSIVSFNDYLLLMYKLWPHFQKCSDGNERK